MAFHPWRSWGRQRGVSTGEAMTEMEKWLPNCRPDRLRLDRSLLRGKTCRRPGAGALRDLASVVFLL